MSIQHGIESEAQRSIVPWFSVKQLALGSLLHAAWFDAFLLPSPPPGPRERDGVRVPLSGPSKSLTPGPWPLYHLLRIERHRVR
jgi:hypothetical protein